MSDGACRELFENAGFAAVEVSVVEQTVVFPDPASAAGGILGTPFGPVIAALPGDQGEALQADLLRRFHPESPGAPISRTTGAVVVRATKESEAEEQRDSYLTLGEVYRFGAVRTKDGWRLSRIETEPLWSTQSLSGGARVGQTAHDAATAS